MDNFFPFAGSPHKGDWTVQLARTRATDPYHCSNCAKRSLCSTVGCTTTMPTSQPHNMEIVSHLRMSQTAGAVGEELPPDRSRWDCRAFSILAKELLNCHLPQSVFKCSRLPLPKCYQLHLICVGYTLYTASFQMIVTQPSCALFGVAPLDHPRSPAVHSHSCRIQCTSFP